MKQNIIYAILLWVAFISLPYTTIFAQLEGAPGKVSWGKELKEPNNSYLEKLVSSGKDGIYALRRKPQDAFSDERIYLEFYSSELKLKRSKKIDLEFKGKDRDFEDVLMVGGQLYLFSSFNNQSKKKNYLFVQGVNKKRLTLERNIEMVGEIETRNKEREGTFNFVQSKDSSKLLIYNELPFQKRQPERFTMRVFDADLSTIWKKDIVLPYNDDQFEVEEYQVDNQGNVYLLGVVYQDGAQRRREGTPTYQYVVIAYLNDGAETQEYRIQLEEKFITDLTFRVGRDGNLVCSGFYSEKGTYYVKGTYFLRLDAKTKEVIVSNYKPFEFEFLTEHLSDRKKRKAAKAEREGNTKKSAELYQYALDELILRSDGGAVLIAEQYYVDVNYFNNFRPFSPFYSPFLFDQRNQVNYYFNYNDIIVVNITPNGEIEWASRIPKRQETINDGGYFSSYAMSVVRDRFYFVYNDNSRNFRADEDNDRIYNYNGRNSIITVAEVLKNGEVNQYPLSSNRDAGIIARPKVSKQIGRKKMLLLGERGRRYRVGELVFE